MSATLPETSYDKIPYPATPFAQTHPRRLSTIAALFGMDPPELSKARVLELGCSDGANQLAMACEFPEGEYVGVELAGTQAEAGQKAIDALGIKNFTLHHADIMDVDESYGTFDYIIVHGVYSWVPAEVQDRILSICRDNLSDNGVAFVSYNTFPGWRMRGMVRDMMMYHTQQFEDAATKAQQARSLLNFLSEAVPKENDAYGQWLASELKNVMQWKDHYVLHESLGEINEPLYFWQFAAKAGEHDLQYLGEAEFSTMLASNFDEKVRETIQRVGRNIIAQEQYMDFIRNRMFRQTLLCKKEIKLSRNLTPELMQKFHIRCNIKPESDQVNVQSNQVEKFQTTTGVTLTSAAPIVKAALLYLSEQHPLSVPFDEVMSAATRAIRQDDVAVVPSEQEAAEQRTLGEVLLRGFSNRIIDISYYPYRYTRDVSEKPKTTELARRQAAVGGAATNLCHEVVRLDAVSRIVLEQLDGETDRDSILNLLVEQCSSGALTVREGGEPITDADRLREILKPRLDVVLARCAEGALLIE